MAGDRRDLVAAFGYGPRAVCRLCGLAFRRDDWCDAEICADCVEFEPGPFQDNDPPGEVAIWYGPLQAPEIVVAQQARREAERCAREAFTALSLTVEALTAIAGQDNRPLRMFPKDQARRARFALQQLEEAFPDLHSMLHAVPVAVQ